MQHKNFNENPDPNLKGNRDLYRPNIFKLIPFIIIILLLLGTLFYFYKINKNEAILPTNTNLLRTKIPNLTAPNTNIEQSESISTQ